MFLPRQEPFTCEHCGNDVTPLTNGSYRNHCPACLYSKHVDDAGPGDRGSDCGGLMHPTGIDYRSNKGWMVLHECQRCGKRIPNSAAPDDDLTTFSGASVYTEN